jgi:hypothetical protein
LWSKLAWPLTAASVAAAVVLAFGGRGDGALAARTAARREARTVTVHFLTVLQQNRFERA